MFFFLLLCATLVAAVAIWWLTHWLRQEQARERRASERWGETQEQRVAKGWRRCPHNSKHTHLWNTETKGLLLYPLPLREVPEEHCEWHRGRAEQEAGQADGRLPYPSESRGRH